MKQPEKFKINTPILSGNIYLIQQDKVKKVVTKGSLEEMNLTGTWVVVKCFENEINMK